MLEKVTVISLFVYYLSGYMCYTNWMKYLQFVSDFFYKEVANKPTCLLFVTRLTLTGHDLTEIPEELGLAPFLSEIDFSNNLLGIAKDWNWVKSPLIRESLTVLDLDNNGVSTGV